MSVKIKQDPKAKEKWKTYPPKVRAKLKNLRSLIMERAKELESVEEVEETLKWGELSYLTKKGSTIRIDSKSKTPEHYAIYFKCTSKLVVTFKEVYGDMFNYETTRAILFKFDEDIPVDSLKECIGAALQYHHVKLKPSLGLVKS